MKIRGKKQVFRQFLIVFTFWIAKIAWMVMKLSQHFKNYNMFHM